MALNLDVHLKNKDAAMKVIIDGLEDPLVADKDRLLLQVCSIFNFSCSCVPLKRIVVSITDVLIFSNQNIDTQTPVQIPVPHRIVLFRSPKFYITEITLLISCSDLFLQLHFSFLSYFHTFFRELNEINSSVLNSR